MTIRILKNDAALAYAARECRKFLLEYTAADVTETDGNADKTVRLTVDGALAPHRYSLCGDGDTLSVAGGSPSAVQCGLYAALSEAGVLFEATGYSLPGAWDTAAFFGARRDVSPKFRQRGIRQHINFPMDISSYSLDDAKEYIRSLARMGMNAITFHSYGGQWHSTEPGKPGKAAGHFFYGQVHPVPREKEIASLIRNRKIFCIPEAEPLLGDEAALEEYAQYWLSEVMDTAKEAGLLVTFSVEIPFDEDDAIVAMLRAVCAAYPQIDTLELLTEECGGRQAPGWDTDNAAARLKELFGDDIADEDGSVPGLPREWLPDQLSGSAVHLARMLRAVSLRERWLPAAPYRPALRVGLYVNCPNTLRILWPILRRKLPAGMTRSLLPAHGAVNVAESLDKIGFTSEDWQSTMIYSWAEFDGNMYIQQMSTDGNEMLTAMPEADSVYGACLNHWRTAENALTLSYFARTSETPLAAEAYYLRYAERKGIADGVGFAAACRLLARCDTYCRDHLPNVGFCYVGCWIRRGNVTQAKKYKAEPLEEAIRFYEEAKERFHTLIPSAVNRDARALLRLYENRCHASVLHLRCMLSMAPIRTMYDYSTPERPASAEVREKIRACLADAMRYAREYLSVYGEMLPDRGGEGNVVSYYETLLPFIRAVAAHFEGMEAQEAKDEFDAPPLPDTSAK